VLASALQQYAPQAGFRNTTACRQEIDPWQLRSSTDVHDKPVQLGAQVGFDGKLRCEVMTTQLVKGGIEGCVRRLPLSLRPTTFGCQWWIIGPWRSRHWRQHSSKYRSP
jgi:hypothetical protein